jgi:hypothetical protein
MLGIGIIGIKIGILLFLGKIFTKIELPRVKNADRPRLRELDALREALFANPFFHIRIRYYNCN